VNFYRTSSHVCHYHHYPRLHAGLIHECVGGQRSAPNLAVGALHASRDSLAGVRGQEGSKGRVGEKGRSHQV